MWRVAIEVYHSTDDSNVHVEYFNSRDAAMNYCEMVKSLNLNADITLEDVSAIDGDEYTDGDTILIQQAVE
jgi:hypothetical protein